MPDARIIDDLPNIVVDEEGFHAAAFRYEEDAKRYVAMANSNHPCACYMLKTEYDAQTSE